MYLLATQRVFLALSSGESHCIGYHLISRKLFSTKFYSSFVDGILHPSGKVIRNVTRAIWKNPLIAFPISLAVIFVIVYFQPSANVMGMLATVGLFLLSCVTFFPYFFVTAYSMFVSSDEDTMMRSLALLHHGLILLSAFALYHELDKRYGPSKKQPGAKGAQEPEILQPLPEVAALKAPENAAQSGTKLEDASLTTKEKRVQKSKVPKKSSKPSVQTRAKQASRTKDLQSAASTTLASKSEKDNLQSASTASMVKPVKDVPLPVSDTPAPVPSPRIKKKPRQQPGSSDRMLLGMEEDEEDGIKGALIDRDTSQPASNAPVARIRKRDRLKKFLHLERKKDMNANE